jgi:hypothetical protein
MDSPGSAAPAPTAADPDRASASNQPEYDSTYDFPAEEPKAADKQPAAKADTAPAEKSQPKAEAKPEPKPEPKSEPAAPKHNPDLVELALEFGATEGEIAEVSPARLKAWVREQASARRQAPEPKKAEPAEDVIEFEHGGQKHKLKADDLDPAVAALFKSLRDSQQQLQTELKAQRESAAAARRQEQIEAAVDFFEEAGDQFAASAEEGKQRRFALWQIAGIAPDTPAAQVRAKLKAAAALFGLAPGGKPQKAAEPAPEAKPVARETPDRDPGTGRFVPDADAKKEMDRWDDAAVPVPTGRDEGPGRKLSPEEASDKAVAAAMKRHGLVPNGRR